MSSDQDLLDQPGCDEYNTQKRSSNLMQDEGASDGSNSFASSLFSSIDSALGLINKAKLNRENHQQQPMQTESAASSAPQHAPSSGAMDIVSSSSRALTRASAAAAANSRENQKSPKVSSDTAGTALVSSSSSPRSPSPSHSHSVSRSRSPSPSRDGSQTFSRSPPAALQRLVLANEKAKGISNQPSITLGKTPGLFKGLGRGWKKGLSKDQLQALTSAPTSGSKSQANWSTEAVEVEYMQSSKKPMWTFTVRSENESGNEKDSKSSHKASEASGALVASSSSLAAPSLPDYSSEDINAVDMNFIGAVQNRLNFLSNSMRLMQRSNRSHAVRSELDQLTLEFHRYRGLAHKLLLTAYRVDEFAEQRTVRRAQFLPEQEKKTLLDTMLSYPAAVQLAALEIAAQKLRSEENKRIRAEYLMEQAQLAGENEDNSRSAAARKMEADAREYAEERADRDRDMDQAESEQPRGGRKKKRKDGSEYEESEEEGQNAAANNSSGKSKKQLFMELFRSMSSNDRFDGSFIEEALSRGHAAGLSTAEIHEFLVVQFLRVKGDGDADPVSKSLKSLLPPARKSKSRDEDEEEESSKSRKGKEKDRDDKKVSLASRRYSSRFHCLCKRLDPSNDERDPQPKIQCDRCDTWFHFKCVGITEEMERKFEKMSHFNWFCPGCELWHCKCKLLDPNNPDDRSKQICCGACKTWFHLHCLQLDTDDALRLFESGNPWFCQDCNKKGGASAPKREEAPAPNTKWNPKFDPDNEDRPVDKRPSDILPGLKKRRKALPGDDSASGPDKKRKQMEIEELDEKTGKRVAKELAQLEDWSWDRQRKRKPSETGKDKSKEGETSKDEKLKQEQSTALVPASAAKPSAQSPGSPLAPRAPPAPAPMLFSNIEIHMSAPFNDRIRHHCVCWNLDPDDHYDRTQQIACTNCRIWFHFKCVGLQNFDPARFKASGITVWYCLRCREDDSNTLNSLAMRLMRDIGRKTNPERYKLQFASTYPTPPPPPPESKGDQRLPRTRNHCECLNLDSDNPDTDNSPQIQCNHCRIWYHLKCVDENVEVVTKLKSWHCRFCRVPGFKELNNYIWSRWCVGYRPNDRTRLPGLMPEYPFKPVTGRRCHCHCYMLDPEHLDQEGPTVQCGNCKVHFHNGCAHYTEEMASQEQSWFCTRCREGRDWTKLDPRRLYLRDCGFLFNKPGVPPGSMIRPKGVPECIQDIAALPKNYYHCFCFGIIPNDPNDHSPQILCNNCRVWYHLACTNHTRDDVQRFMDANQGWFCPRCRQRNDPMMVSLKALDLKDVGKYANYRGELPGPLPRVGRIPKRKNKPKPKKPPTQLVTIHSNAIPQRPPQMLSAPPSAASSSQHAGPPAPAPAASSSSVPSSSQMIGMYPPDPKPLSVIGPVIIAASSSCGPIPTAPAMPGGSAPFKAPHSMTF